MLIVMKSSKVNDSDIVHIERLLASRRNSTDSSRRKAIVLRGAKGSPQSDLKQDERLLDAHEHHVPKKLSERDINKTTQINSTPN